MPGETDALFFEIRAFLEAHRNPARVLKYARYFREGYDAYGTPPALLEQEKQAWLAAHRARFGLPGFLDLGDRLVAGGRYEEVFLAYWFVLQFPETLKPEVFPRLARWLEVGICNWAMVDSFSSDLAAPFLLDRVVPLAALSPWRCSPSRWMRRAVPVTLIRPLKAGWDAPEILAFLVPLMPDEERVVQQGLGWLLREAWVRHPGLVEAFLVDWKDRCGTLVVRTATEKVPKEQQGRFRRGRAKGRGV